MYVFFYRPPSADVHIFDHLCSYLQSIDAIHFPILFVLVTLMSILMMLLFLYGLSQIVTGPTHSHHSGSMSTIDLMFVSDNTNVHSCETVPHLGNSDHNGILTTFTSTGGGCARLQPCKERLVWRCRLDYCLKHYSMF